jgi:hypothetical protein
LAWTGFFVQFGKGFLPPGSDFDQILVDYFTILIHKSKIKGFVCPDGMTNLKFIQ